MLPLLLTSTFYHTIEHQPVTFTLCVFMFLLFCYHWNYNVPYSKLGMHYDKIITGGEYWRLPLATLSHGSLLHILFNLFGLWTFGTIETYLGTLTYLRYTYLLFAGCCALMLFGTMLLLKYGHGRYEGQRTVYTVGYSGIVFGWMAVAAILIPQPQRIFGFSIPAWLVPFLYLALTQFLIPNASLIGHLSGVLIGFMIGAGWFEWVDDYLCLTAVIWTLLSTLVSLKLTTDVNLPCIQIIDPNEEVERDMHIVRGEIVYRDAPGAPQQADDGSEV